MRVSEFQRVARLRTTSNHIMLHCNLDQRKKTAKTQRKMRIKEEEINFRIVFFCSFFYIWIYDSALTTTRKYQKEKKKIIHKIICHIKFIIMQKEGVRRIFSMCSLLLACVVHIKDLSYRVIFSWWLQLHIQMIRYFFFVCSLVAFWKHKCVLWMICVSLQFTNWNCMCHRFFSFSTLSVSFQQHLYVRFTPTDKHTNSHYVPANEIESRKKIYEKGKKEIEMLWRGQRTSF